MITDEIARELWQGLLIGGVLGTLISIIILWYSRRIEK